MLQLDHYTACAQLLWALCLHASDAVLQSVHWYCGGTAGTTAGTVLST